MKFEYILFLDLKPYAISLNDTTRPRNDWKMWAKGCEVGKFGGQKVDLPCYNGPECVLIKHTEIQRILNQK